MSNYRRSNTAGACYFFTVVTCQRKKIFSDNENIDVLRGAFRKIKKRQPFEIEAIVILHDHLHCLWKLPKADNDYSGRWREIKKHVTRQISDTRNKRNEGDVWQRRFWEHQIRDEKDWQNHMDYIHYNPVKHGYVSQPSQWPYSSFGKWVRNGVYEMNWGASHIPKNIEEINVE